MVEDYHVHSRYSDGGFLPAMVKAARSAGLSGVGFADHCNVSTRERRVEARALFGFNLDLTYQRRRDAIQHLNERSDIRIYDAVEMDYDPRDEDAIASFLDEAAFDYAIGSVHELDGTNVHFVDHFREMTEDGRRALLDTYFEKLRALVTSELFDVAGHVDLIERNPALRGLATDEQYHRIAAAFECSRTVPELNAGRVLDDYGEFHPAPRFLETLREYDVPITIGSDSHRPDEIAARHERIQSFIEERGIVPVELDL